MCVYPCVTSCHCVNLATFPNPLLLLCVFSRSVRNTSHDCTPECVSVCVCVCVCDTSLTPCSLFLSFLWLCLDFSMHSGVCLSPGFPLSFSVYIHRCSSVWCLLSLHR